MPYNVNSKQVDLSILTCGCLLFNNKGLLFYTLKYGRHFHAINDNPIERISGTIYDRTTWIVRILTLEYRVPMITNIIDHLFINDKK